MKAALPSDEAARLAVLHELMATSDPADPAFDDLTALAAHICQAPCALISLVDEDWQHFRARVGVDISGTPRAISICAHAILQHELLVIPDLQDDPRFFDNPLVAGEASLRFYAGAPLQTSDGHRLGTLCVFGREPRDLTLSQRQALKVLSHHVVTQLELRRSDARRRQAETALHAANAELEHRVEQRTKALREAHNRLELAIGASNIGLWEWSLATDRIENSLGWMAELGLTDAERPTTGTGWHARMHPEDLPRILETLGAYVADPLGEFEQEMRLKHEDGTYRWVLVRARISFGVDGRPEKLVGCHIDLTERRETQDRLLQSGERLRELAAHLQSVREEETGRIARELHDELGAALTGLKFDAAWIERQLTRLLPDHESEALRQRLRELNDGLDAMIGSVRKVCQDLRPAILDELGLAVAMEWQANEFSTRTGLPCRFHRTGEILMEPARATAIFRILQELLTNVARHAHPASVAVEVKQENRLLELVVADDGCGLPPDVWTRRGGGFGLVGIRERVLAAGGTVDFDSAPGQGTRVTVRVPCEKSPFSR